MPIFPQTHPAAPRLPRPLFALRFLLPATILAVPVFAGPALAGRVTPIQEQPAQQSTPAAGESVSVTESALQSRLVGKQLFLRGGWLGDSLNFTEHGDPVGHPAVGSYTLSAIQIDKVHLTKHRVELIGSRYGLHFLGALPYENAAGAVDRIKITPKKKVLKITIDREIVVKPKKAPKSAKETKKAAPAADRPVASSESDAPVAVATASPSAAASETEDQKSEKPGEEAAADQASVTTTLSPAHAARLLSDALDKIFAPSLDDKMRAQMPEFWQLYYQAQAAGVDFRPKDPAILRPAAVDQQAKLVNFGAPDSNDYAQASGIAGPALYRVVVGADGKPQQIAVERPIGFGLDENAVAAIRKAAFQPAVKGGQPVAESLDLTIVFRIYSKRTAQPSAIAEADPAKAAPTNAASSVKPALPGPYSVQQAASTQTAAPAPAPEPSSAPTPEPKP